MRGDRPLKRSMSGEEMEFFILNHKGEMVNDASKLIHIAKKRFSGFKVYPEAGQSIVEISSFPSVSVLDTFADLLEKVKKLIQAADKHEYLLYPNATYPGYARTEITRKRRYLEQEMLFGRKHAIQATLVTGFHYHYTLPRGVFDKRTEFLKPSGKSKLSWALINSYNMAIAIDPALTTLMQSSPFVQGKYLAKDSRMLIYRGGNKLGCDYGKYAQHQLLGGLQPYSHTTNDLISTLKKKHSLWKEMRARKGLSKKTNRKENILEFSWNPVRINKLGTLEQRGMDMNHPKRAMAISSLLKFLFRKLQREFYKAEPSDIGIKEPFKMEGDTIYIPPNTYVRDFLQRESAYKGFESREIDKYVSRFYRLARQLADRNYRPVLQPLQKMINEKETVSDMIIKRIRKMGYGKEIPNDAAAESALKSCEYLLNEVDNTEEKLYKAYGLAEEKF
ncbi:hypothetical protein J4401_06575 [Candidatus Woesearchaeota archaeon]|nr:hypothetical protein [Candidatus Woesearchaeota archaeon]